MKSKHGIWVARNGTEPAQRRGRENPDESRRTRSDAMDPSSHPGTTMRVRR